MKKGTVFDLFPLMLFALTLAVTLISLASFNIFFRDNVITEQSEVFDDNVVNFTNVLNNVDLGFFAVSLWFPIIMIVGFGLVVIFVASQVRSSPLIAIFSIIALLVILIFAGIVGNVYEAFAATSFTTAKASEYTLVTFFFQNIVQILIGIGLIVAYVLHRQKSAGELG